MKITNILSPAKSNNELPLKTKSFEKKDLANEKPFSNFLTEATSKEKKTVTEKAGVAIETLENKSINFTRGEKTSKEVIKKINALLDKLIDKTGKTSKLDEGKKILQELKKFFQSLDEQIDALDGNQNGFLGHFLKELQNFFKKENISTARPAEIKNFLFQQKDALKNILPINLPFNTFNEETVERVKTLNDLKELWEDAKVIENQKKLSPVKNGEASYTVMQGNIKNNKNSSKIPIHNSSNSSPKIASSNNFVVLESLSSGKKIAPTSPALINTNFTVVDAKGFQNNFSPDNNFSFFVKSENNSFLDKNVFFSKVSGGQKLDPMLLQNQLIKNIKNGLVEGKEVMTVKLKPEALGEIKIIMKKENDFLHLKLLVDNYNVKEIMEQKLMDLKQYLAEENIDLLSLGIDLQQKSSSDKEEFSTWLAEDKKVDSKNSMENNQLTTGNAIIDLRSQKVLNLII